MQVKKLLIAGIFILTMSACNRVISPPTVVIPPPTVAVTARRTSLPVATVGSDHVVSPLLGETPIDTVAAPTVAAPVATPTRPVPELTAQAFLWAWAQGDYAQMYQYLSTAAQANISQDRFIQRYGDIAAEATIIGISSMVTARQEDAWRATVSYSITIQTILVGDVETDNAMPLVWENGAWRVEWAPSLIFKELSGNNLIHTFDRIPTRGNIYDRTGLPLAAEGAVVTVGVVPNKIQDETRLLQVLSDTLQMSPEEIKAKYSAGQPDWFMPIKDIPFEASQEHYNVLNSVEGIALREKSLRVYPQGTLTAQAVGYLGEIDAVELQLLTPLGYQLGDNVGKSGLEKWGEPYLAGKRGGVLSVITPEGQVVTAIKSTLAKQSRSLFTSLNLSLQQAADAALGDKIGAIVAIDPRNGEVLAMVSHPAYDPNALAWGLTVEEWGNLLNDLDRPLVNRATQSGYAPASVFKIVTAGAALERGGLTVSTTFTCEGTWQGLGESWPKTCWLKTGHGTLDMYQGLVKSCDIYFYEVGKHLDQTGNAILPTFARECGFGRKTGIELDETPGIVPDDDWKVSTQGHPWFVGDSVNLAIGQGYILVTPLQVANFIAAVGNGGVLYRPRLVTRVTGNSAEPEITFPPEELGRLPYAPENLQMIRRALRDVTNPGGTAYKAFAGSALAVAGKTGTAENSTGTPHSWFAGYLPADDPQLAMAVIVEQGGEGSAVAAPIFRQVAEAFFAPQPGTERTGN